MKNSPKKQKQKKKKIVMVSGGFDPVHIGHVRMFNEAKKLGDELVVVVNNDNWLRLKKGYVFMPEGERKEIIEAFEAVDRVILSSHERNTKDISICRDLLTLRPHIFAKGGDRHSGNIPTPEVSVCEEIGCAIVNDIGFGGKVQSSSDLVKKARDAKKGSGSRPKSVGNAK
ncbi:MAG TPA: adenylyltransferase/cytidyltransferase family protein [Candidatus Paceibacterota bacterium]|nr:adenylyltransferase/cytidyltransferase family protein [Candidatus Paceibacterota bacterium]